jgi:cytochrome c peroxidase
MTLRNVDKRPRPDFVKAYGHNGYFKSLKEIVHFYNTRDTLPRCAAGAKKYPAGRLPRPRKTSICIAAISASPTGKRMTSLLS